MTFVHAGVIMIGEIGVTVCIITRDFEILSRTLYVHGRVITLDKPLFMEEAAVVHAIRSLHDWALVNKTAHEQTESIRIHAGDFATVSRIQRWFLKGARELASAMAGPLSKDLENLEQWVNCPLILRPFGLKSEDGKMDKLSWIHTEILRASEEFRSIVLSKVGLEWSKGLPVVPLTKSEVKSLVQERHNKDEIVALRILATLESESTAIIVKLGLTREMVKAALAGLQTSHSDQINLLRVLCGTRYKYPYLGILLPTQCPNTRNGRECNEEDSFDHMVSCYKLQVPPSGDPGNIDFLIGMAKSTAPGTPGGPRPMYLVRTGVA